MSGARVRTIALVTQGPRRGPSSHQTIHTPDALIAGTARAHGAVLLTHNVDDFPMNDLRVELPEATND